MNNHNFCVCSALLWVCSHLNETTTIYMKMLKYLSHFNWNFNINILWASFIFLYSPTDLTHLKFERFCSFIEVQQIFSLFFSNSSTFFFSFLLILFHSAFILRWIFTYWSINSSIHFIAFAAKLLYFMIIIVAYFSIIRPFQIRQQPLKQRKQHTKQSLKIQVQ